MNVEIRKQNRKTLAFKLTPDGALAFIPSSLDADSVTVNDFIAQALASLPRREEDSSPLQPADIHDLIAQWSERLGVEVSRIQIRTMKNKWGSVSTAGTLTLADDLLSIPYDLVEYVVVHELLHLKFPDHRKGWHVSMGMYLPDWHERERRLLAYIRCNKLK